MAQGRQVILSDRVWRTRFAADPGMVGRTVLLNAQPMTVVGVMPPGVQHPGNNYHALADGDTVDLWLPFPYDGNPNSRGSHFMEGIGRLKAGVSPEQAGADLTTVLAQLASEHPADRGWRVFLVPLYREMVGQHAAHAAGAAFGGGAAAADCVRECGEPAAGAGPARGCARLRCGPRWERRAGASSANW